MLLHTTRDLTNVDSVNANVVFDYFFNGIRDDDAPSDDHYEYQYVPPLPFPVHETAGGWHADIPWNGEREVDYPPYYTASQYRDALVTDVDGAGGDPYAFSLRFVKGANVVGGLQPQGVFSAGVGTGLATTSVESGFFSHGPQDVASYAVYNAGAGSHTGTVTVASITMASPTCKLTRYREGKGKNATWIQTRTVTADYSIKLAFDPAPPPTAPDSPSYVWVEFHFVDNEVISRRRTATTSQPMISGTVRLALPDGDPDFDVALAVDYAYPTGILMDYAYDPANNLTVGFNTTAGFGGAPWAGAQTALDAGEELFPVATTPAVGISCQQ